MPFCQIDVFSLTQMNHIEYDSSHSTSKHTYIVVVTIHIDANVHVDVHVHERTCTCHVLCTIRLIGNNWKK
jgi:hypothetical protein